MTLVFSTPEPHHFSDYGFDPQITHFQFVEESRRHCRGRASLKPIDTIRFKLQKPISKDEYKSRTAAKAKSKTKKKRWWKKALGYLKAKWADKHGPKKTQAGQQHRNNFILGPVYSTESVSVSTTHYRNLHRTTPFGWMTSGTQVPYMSLGEMDDDGSTQRISTSSTPLYLVT